jgi:hypothetical protein
MYKPEGPRACDMYRPFPGSWGSQLHHALIPQAPAYSSLGGVMVDRRLGWTGEQGRPFSTPSGRSSRAAAVRVPAD